jgi:hypothetical protein
MVPKIKKVRSPEEISLFLFAKAIIIIKKVKHKIIIKLIILAKSVGIKLLNPFPAEHKSTSGNGSIRR